MTLLEFSNLILNNCLHQGTFQKVVPAEYLGRLRILRLKIGASKKVPAQYAGWAACLTGSAQGL